jgi:hypothetical protein
MVAATGFEAATSTTVASMAGGLNEPSIIAKLWHHVQRSGYFDRKGLLGRYTV